MAVLMLTDISMDAHAGPVALELARRGVEVFIFNPGDFPVSAVITTESTGCGMRTNLTWNDATLDLDRVRSVWYRRPGKFQLPDDLLPEEADWLNGECASFVNGIWAGTNALWVSDPVSIRRAGFKVFQLRLAREIGFDVPPYIVTNDPTRAREFIEAHPDGVIAKALGTPTLQIRGEGAGMIYTHRITHEDLAELDSVRHGPTHFQAFVRKKRDVRVTVIDDQVFAVAIESGRVAAAQVDFRQAETIDLPHVPISLAGQLESACRMLVQRLGLRFGAIDLLETSDGDYVFLEINPNGQWLWLEMVTELPLSRAMADLLERGLHGQATDSPTASPVKRHTIPFGSQTIPIAASLAERLAANDGDGALNLAGTRAWLERQRDQLYLHVGDVDSNQEQGFSARSWPEAESTEDCTETETAASSDESPGALN